MSFTFPVTKLSFLPFLLAVLFVLCTSFLGHIHHGSYREAVYGHEHMNCCSSGYLFDGHLPYVISENFFLSTVLLVSPYYLSLLVFSLFLLASSLLRYVCLIRDRYGGFLIFNYFSSLFRTGILHSRDNFMTA